MSQDTKAIIELLKKNPHGIHYLVATAGDRHILDVPVDIIKKHKDFIQIRGQDPKDISILQSSMKETSGPLYMPCLYVELSGDELTLFVADGHQRLDGAKANGDKTIVCQYISRWDSVEKAMADAVSLQWARFEPVEADIVSLIRCGKLTQAEIARKTGHPESKISRLAKVAASKLDWLYKAVKDSILGLGLAGKLVDACNDNADKLAALQNTFQQTRDNFEEQRKRWANHMKAHKRKWDRKTKDKAKIATYFKEMDWTAWIDALEADDGITEIAGRKFLKIDETTAATKSGVRIGDSSDWKKEFAVYGIFEQKIEDVDPDDINYVLDNWEPLRDILVAIRDKKELPSLNPIKTVDIPPPPTVQNPQMKTGRSGAATE